jgi:hypothetical protein
VEILADIRGTEKDLLEQNLADSLACSGAQGSAQVKAAAAQV